MDELFAQYPVLRWVVLVSLFALVAVGAYLIATAISQRQFSRKRLVEGGAFSGPEILGTSLRAQTTESAWLKLVNGIEKAGLSLVDTRGDALRQKLVAAGYKAAYGPRLYTLIRLLLVIGLPTTVFLAMYLTGAMPGMMHL